MNCIRCGTRLAERARFCPNCGLPIAASTPSTPPTQQSALPPDETVPILLPPLEPRQPPAQQQAWPLTPQTPPAQQMRLPAQQDQPPWAPTVPVSPPQQWNGQQPQLSPQQTPSPLSYYQHNNRGVKMPPAVVTTPASRSRRGCLGCGIATLITLIILIIIGGAGWIFGLRPYLHTVAVTQLNQTLASATQQIPPQIAQLPPGPLPVTETAVNNMIALNIAPSDPIQHAQAHLTTSGISLDFQLYGNACTITMVPKAQNGKLIATNVTVQGIIGLIMTPDELTTLLNQHFADVQKQLNHSIQAVFLKNQEMDLLLGL